MEASLYVYHGSRMLQFLAEFLNLLGVIFLFVNAIGLLTHLSLHFTLCIPETFPVYAYFTQYCKCNPNLQVVFNIVFKTSKP